jgi:hypothetical protein
MCGILVGDAESFLESENFGMEIEKFSFAQALTKRLVIYFRIDIWRSLPDLWAP